MSNLFPEISYYLSTQYPEIGPSFKAATDSPPSMFPEIGDPLVQYAKQAAQAVEPNPRGFVGPVQTAMRRATIDEERQFAGMNGQMSDDPDAFSPPNRAIASVGEFLNTWPPTKVAGDIAMGLESVLGPGIEGIDKVPGLSLASAAFHGTPEEIRAAKYAMSDVLYRGENTATEGRNVWGAGKHYTPDAEFARQFTQSGRPEEVKKTIVHSKDIFTPEQLPYAGDAEAMDSAIEQAKASGFKAVRLSEGHGQPASVFVFDKSALGSDADAAKMDNLKKWFADSKVADNEGNPIPVYHGTRENFDTSSKDNSAMGGVTWFSSDPKTAQVFAGDSGRVGVDAYPPGANIKQLYASLKNPAGWEEYEKYGLGELRSMGYDGAILKDPDGGFTGFAFEPKQLKSATGNSGKFSPKKASIVASGLGAYIAKDQMDGTPE